MPVAESGSDNYQELTRLFIRELKGMLGSSPWSEAVSRLDKLEQQIDEPCSVAVAGRVKAGKSSFLNAYIGGDYALVGSTATTATINYFRFGVPADARRPVRCKYRNGSESWENQEFLDNLQGHSLDTLRRAEAVESLSYYINNPNLQLATIIDTPGTGSTVEQHQEESERFLRLCQYQEQASAQLSGQADAIIYIFKGTINQQDVDSLKSFLNNLGENESGRKSTAIMVVITNIDQGIRDIAAHTKKQQDVLDSQLGGRISVVLPVSAALQRFCDSYSDGNGGWKDLDLLERLQRKARHDWDEDDEDDPEPTWLDIESQFTVANLKEFSAEELARLRGNTPWSAFQFVVRVLVKLSVREALDYCRRVAGFTEVHSKLDDMFLHRSQLLRCSRIVNDIYRYLRTISDEWPKLLERLRQEAATFANVTRYVNGLRGDVAIVAKLKEIVAAAEPQVEDWKPRLDDARLKADRLRRVLHTFNLDFSALQLLAENPDQFSADEFTQLEYLLGKYGVSTPERLPPSIEPNQMASYFSSLQMTFNDKSRSCSRGIVRHTVLCRARDCCGEIRARMG